MKFLNFIQIKARFAFNNFKPESAVRINITNERKDTVLGYYFAKRLTHEKGFMMTLEVNQSYLIVFDQATSKQEKNFGL